MGMNGKKIKNRLRSVSSTMHMTKAMELVASSKLKRATANMHSSRGYFEEMETAFDNLLSSETKDSVFVKPREVNKRCIIVVAGDRGLAGGYNNNVFKAVQEELGTDGVVILPVGKKAIEYYSRRGYAIIDSNCKITEDVTVADCSAVGYDLTKRFADGEFDAVDLVYTKYVNVLTQRPATKRLLPLCGKDEVKNSQYIMFSPNSEEVLDALVPEYVSGLVYGAVCESFASELSARRNAMDSATQNAEEMIEMLNLQYNRARQAAITQEITEIIGGSEA